MRTAHSDLFSNPEEALAIAQGASEAWNTKAKKEGWPDRRTASDFMRNRRAISRIYKGVKKAQEILPNVNPKDLILWILEAWNWEKSCPPTGLLESQAKWASLHLMLSEKAEENSLAGEEKLEKLAQWLDKEYGQRIRAGESPEAARKSTEEFARASGKLQSLNTQEKLYFCQRIEKLENYAKSH